jgi:hypothetical protein
VAVLAEQLDRQTSLLVVVAQAPCTAMVAQVAQ